MIGPLLAKRGEKTAKLCGYADAPAAQRKSKKDLKSAAERQNRVDVIEMRLCLNVKRCMVIRGQGFTGFGKI